MNNTEDPFLEDMNWINRTCKKSKKSMSETEINEDNCVLKVSELVWIDRAFESVLDDVKIFEIFSDRQYVTDTLKTTFQKIKKLNDLAKEKQNGRG